MLRVKQPLLDIAGVRAVNSVHNSRRKGPCLLLAQLRSAVLCATLSSHETDEIGAGLAVALFVVKYSGRAVHANTIR